MSRTKEGRDALRSSKRASSGSVDCASAVQMEPKMSLPLAAAAQNLRKLGKLNPFPEPAFAL